MSVGLVFDFSALDGLANRVRQMGQIDRRALADAIGDEVEDQARYRIEKEKADEWGRPWPEWSPNYADTRHGDHKILEGLGELRKSIDHAVYAGGTAVEVGSNRPYAATHQFGDKRPSRNIPARPYLGLSAENQADVEALIDEFLTRVAP